MKKRLIRPTTTVALAIGLAVVASSCSVTNESVATAQIAPPATSAPIVEDAATAPNANTPQAPTPTPEVASPSPDAVEPAEPSTSNVVEEPESTQSEFDWVDGEYIESLLEKSISAERANQLSDDEVQCITAQVIEAGERGAGTPIPVAELMAEWCAPQRWATWWAESESTLLPRLIGSSLDSGSLIQLDDPEQRHCMATVVVEERVSGSFYDLLDLRLDGLDPFGPTRARIDERLANECGLDAAAGIAAGLRARIEVDNSDTAQTFCREFNRRVPPSQDLRETVAGEISYHQSWYEQDRAITAPAAVATEWEQWISSHERKGQLAAELNLAGTDLDRSAEWETIKDELKFEAAKRIVFEYWDINC